MSLRHHVHTVKAWDTSMLPAASTLTLLEDLLSSTGQSVGLSTCEKQNARAKGLVFGQSKQLHTKLPGPRHVSAAPLFRVRKRVPRGTFPVRILP